MGCLFASYLKKAGHEVSLLEILPERVDRINRQGIHVEGVRGRHRVKVPAFSAPPSVEPDLVMVCVKAYDTLQAARNIREILGPIPKCSPFRTGWEMWKSSPRSWAGSGSWAG